MITYPLIERRSSPRPPLHLTLKKPHPVKKEAVELDPPVYTVKLYAIPSIFGEEFDADEYPKPTPSAALPDLHRWVASYIVSFMEMWAGRRNPEQLISRTHRAIFHTIIHCSGKMSEIPKIKHLSVQEPLDGLCEAVATFRDGNRLRAIALRCEGVDGRWLCTALEIL